MINKLVEHVQSLFGVVKVEKEPKIIPPEIHKINPRNVSAFAVSICKKLQDAGFKAFVVGGAVRDLLIGHKPKDFDVATDATPEQIKRVTKRAIIIGRRFRLVHVIRRSERIEVSTFRALNEEGIQKDSNGRVIQDNVFGEQYEDAARRDFTINALYYDPISREVLDYHNGIADIKKKKLRMIGDPKARYREDPVRILRAIRIASKLGFEIDRKTAAPIKSMEKLLAAVPEARILDETLKIFSSGAALKCVDELSNYGISDQLPVLGLLIRSKDNLMVRKALDRCDARIQRGQSVSPSFLFAVLLWPKLKEVFSKLPEGEPPSRKWNVAITEVCESQTTRGIQHRYMHDLSEIWRLQARFERRTGLSPFKLYDHPRFRAAYDFLQIRASCEEVPHELADWWTAFESAAIDEKEEMVEEMQRKVRAERGSRASPKRPRKKAAEVVAPQENAVVPVQEKEPTQKESNNGKRPSKSEHPVAINRFRMRTPHSRRVRQKPALLSKRQ